MLMKTILIVDDEKPFVMSLRDGLDINLKDTRICISSSGRDAIREMKSQAIDLLLLDLHMPDIDGYGVLKNMKKCNMNIPVIIMSAYGSGAKATAEALYPIVRFLEKPLDFNELLAIIETVLIPADAQ